MHIVLVNNLQKKKERIYKNLNKQEIHDIFIKMNWINIIFNMTWIMEILKT